MSIERVKKSSKSLIWMMVSLIIGSVVPFIMRTVMIRCLGEEYVGLNSLFTSILQVLSISELGIGEALIFYLYKPMAKGDKKRVNEILYLYKLAYRIIGIIILCVALVLIPFLPKLVKGDVPGDINMYVLYLIYIFDLLVSYFYKSYCLSIFQTNQSLYYRYRSESVIWVIVYSLQIYFIIRFKTYYGYVMMIPVATIMINTATWFLARKYYPDYRPDGKPEKSFYPDFWKKVMAMSLMKLRDVFRFSLDSIVISSFLGLVILAKYNNYFLIFASAGMFINILSKAMLQSLGNSVATENIESNRGVIKMYSFLLQFLLLVICSGMMCLYNIFITCWIGEEYQYPWYTVALFVITFYLQQMAGITGLIRNSTGIWSVGKWIPIAETIVNLVMDVVLVQFFNENGVLIGTIVSLVMINIPFETMVMFREYFKENAFKVLFDYVLNAIIAAGIISVCYTITEHIGLVPGIFSFVIKGIICVFISSGLFMIIHIKDSRLADLFKIIKSVIIKM